MMVSYRGRNIPFSPVKTVLTLLFMIGGMGVLGLAFTSDKGAADFFDVGGYFAEDAEPVRYASKDDDSDDEKKESEEDRAKKYKGEAKSWLKFRKEPGVKVEKDKVYDGWQETKKDSEALEDIDKDIQSYIDKKDLTGEAASDYRRSTRKEELGKLQSSKVSISWFAWLVIFIALGSAGFALFTAKNLFAQVKAKEPGNKLMVEIADAVTDGAMAYLNRQKKIVTPTLVGVAVVIALIVGALGADAWWLSIFVLFGILTGGALSFLAGWIGMKTATMASSRTAWACKQDGLDGGLQVAFKAGAVMGLLVVGLGLAFVSAWALVMFGIVDLASDEITMKEAANAMITFGLGASLVALFARVGGGIFTKAADVGADLVGKVEAGIPEDDPRNPATIADNVGDNVGDVAGMGADLYESYVGSILAAIALSWSAAFALGRNPWDFMAAPLLIAAGGILLSIYSTRLVKAKEGANLKELLHSLHKGVNFASIGSAGVAFFVCLFFFGWAGLGFFGAAVVGLVSGLIIGKGSELYTAYDFKPTQDIAKASVTGPATVIISGLAVGMKSTWIPMITVAVATLLAFGLGGGFAVPAAGLYAIALAAVGMLSTLGITLATDAYGPIADNAGGNAEMAKLPAEVRERTDALDSLGNTTAAIGKGFAIGSAALTALALIASFQDGIRGYIKSANEALELKYNALVADGKLDAAAEIVGIEAIDISLTNPAVIVGLFIGAMLVFIFGALTMQAVGDAAKEMVEEVRRQFREEPGIMLGTVKPDYARCVDISTTSALRLMMLPSILAVAGPILTGVLFGASAVFGLLAGGLAAGFAFAVMMSNAGGAWDNAKKWVEKGGLAEAFIEDGTYDPAKEDAALEPVTADQGGPDGQKKGKKGKKGSGRSGKNKKSGTSAKQNKTEDTPDKKDETKDDAKSESKEDSKAEDKKEETKPDAKTDKKSDESESDKSEDSGYKKYVKGTEEHKATVVGDTVGDPFKDTSGPSLNILIKLMSMVSVATVALIMAVNNGQGILSWVFDAIFKY